MARLCLAILLSSIGIASAAEPKKPNVDLTASIDVRGLPMAECDFDVFRIQLLATLDAKGTGTGTLILDSTPKPVDEFGQAVTAKSVPALKLECELKLAKSKKILVEGGPGAPAREVVIQLIEITGPKIVSQLAIAHEVGAKWSHARFIWATKEGKNRTAVPMTGPRPKQELFPPCHPGCFPAGTRVETPKGTRAIEDFRVGHLVSTLGPDGKLSQAKVSSMFLTKNRLVEVTVDDKKLLTTTTQPLALVDGTLRSASELKAGDRIFIWVEGKRKSAKVKSVEVTLREAPVYNVVLGEPTLFIADGFVARSKPPAPAVPIP